MRCILQFGLFCDKQPPGKTSRNSRVIFGDMYISRVEKWDSARPLRFQFVHANLTLHAILQKHCLSRSAALDFSQFKTPKQMKSFVKIKCLMKYTILRWFWFFKNVYQPVEFMSILLIKRQFILRFTSTKFPEMEIFGFLEKFITYEWFWGWRLKSYHACHGRLPQLGGLQ